MLIACFCSFVNFKLYLVTSFFLIANYYLIFQIIEEEAAKRIELLVKKRVDEELEKRKDEIEYEVAKRVEAAKQEMEAAMMIELENRRKRQKEEERKREVWMRLFYWLKVTLYINKLHKSECYL